MFQFSLPKYAIAQLGTGSHTSTFMHIGDGVFVGDALPPIIEGAAPKDTADDGVQRFAVQIVDSVFPDGVQVVLRVADIEGSLAEEFRRIEQLPDGKRKLADLMIAMECGPLALWRKTTHPLTPAAVATLASLATGLSLDAVLGEAKKGG